MSDTARKILGVLLAVACLAAAFAFMRMQSRAHDETASEEARAAAVGRLGEAELALRAEADLLARRAESGAKTLDPVLKEAAVTDDATRQQLANTIVDVISNESWWAPYRALGRQLFFLGGQPVSGAADDVSRVGPLVQDAETSGSAAAVMLLSDGPALVAAGRVPQPSLRQERGVVVIVTRIDRTLLARVAEKAGATFGVLGGTSVLSAGSRVDRLQAWLDGGRAADDTCCAVKSLGGGLEIAAAIDPAPFLEKAAEETSRTRLPAFVIAGLLAMGALVFGFRRGGSSEQEQLLRETAAQLQAQREELQRLSQQISNPNIALNPSAANTGVAHGASGADDGLGATSASIVQSRYEEVAPLGQGGMAKVSVAVVRGAEGFRRLFVVKRLRPELAGTPELVNQFIDEARLGASLVHSNVVPVFDFGRDADGYYMAQEYILGRDVDAVVQASMKKRGRALEVPLVLAIAHEALKALSYAHAKTDDSGRALGLVHRDVSPNNLMLSARGEVKLLDFGIVKSEQRLTKTQTGIVKGNLFFMSPEQAKGVPLDARSDLFSLGLVLFYAATGETLYAGGSSYELLTRAAQGIGEGDVARVRALGEPLAGLILKALQLDPNARHLDADDFARAIAATGQVASAADLKLLMELVLKDELAEEQGRFAVREGA